MLEYLAQLMKWFQFSHQSNLESFIISKNPQNESDIEHWMRVYEKGTKFYLS